MFFVRSIFKTLSNTLSFDGRSTRLELNLFLLFICVLASLMAIRAIQQQLNGSTYFLGTCLALSIPLFSLIVRRLHDLNRSGWFVILVFVPYLQWPFLLMLMVIKSDDHKNRYSETMAKVLSQPIKLPSSDLVETADMSHHDAIQESLDDMIEMLAIDDKFGKKFYRLYEEQNHDAMIAALIAEGWDPEKAKDYVGKFNLGL